MTQNANPFKVGDQIVFAPEEYPGPPSADVVETGIFPGEQGVVSKIEGDKIFMGEYRIGIPWPYFKKVDVGLEKRAMAVVHFIVNQVVAIILTVYAMSALNECSGYFFPWERCLTPLQMDTRTKTLHWTSNEEWYLLLLNYVGFSIIVACGQIWLNRIINRKLAQKK